MRRYVLIGGVLLAAVAGLAPTSAHAATWKFCGHSASALAVLANENTTCQFARATSRKVGTTMPRTVRPYSAALHRRIVMRRTGCGCNWSSPFVYRGGNEAAVKFGS